MALATCVATPFEKRRRLPVDAVIPDPLFTSTHAITIDAPAEEVWPWIAQRLPRPLLIASTSRRMTLEHQDDIDGAFAKRALVARNRGQERCAGDTAQ
jgi:hypothetical protein